MSPRKNCFEDDQTINEVLRKIEIESVLDAAKLLINAGKSLPQYPNSCIYPQKPSYRFYTSDETYPFSFIVNKKSLLFYLRASAPKSKKFNFKELQKVFPKIKENKLGEWNFHVTEEQESQFIIENILKVWL